MPTHWGGVQVASAGRVGGDLLERVRRMADLLPNLGILAKRAASARKGHSARDNVQALATMLALLT